MDPMVIAPMSTCGVCRKDLYTLRKEVAEMAPCSHRVHAKCRLKLDHCRDCGIVIREYSIVTISTAHKLRPLTTGAKQSLQRLKQMDPKSHPFTYEQMDQFYALFLRCLELISKKAPPRKMGTARITMSQNYNPPDIRPRIDGFYRGEESWPDFLLKKTLKRLNMMLIDNGNRRHELVKKIERVDVAILILDIKVEERMINEDQDPLGFKYARRGYEARCTNESKADQTYILNVKYDSRSDLEQVFTGAHHYHIDTLRSLYESHLQMAANIGGCSRKFQDKILKTFEKNWSLI